ncbi:MAG TPA: DUF3467 domain-containing protein [Candidatus Acetothermia bacterium]|nr:DUF3467 domain-containing protein [Candidatus Acetothermia bacterium]
MAEEKPKVQVPIEWHISEDINSKYATNLVVQHSEHEFILDFFEMRRPLILGNPDQVREQWQKIESVRAECVAQIIVSPDRMQEFIDVMQAALDKYVGKEQEEQ